jgi:membrane-associated phospholipid phosphatase
VIAPTSSPVRTADDWSLPVPRLRYFGPFAVQYLLWLGLYLAVNHATAGRSVAQPLLPFEARIPLVLWAYPFYAAVYPEILLPLFLARTRRTYIRTQLAVGIASIIAFVVFLAAPMAYPRPAVEPHGALSFLLALEYAVDGPRCTFPSLHVAVAWIFYLGLRDEAPRWRLVLLGLALSVTISTVLVKQHFAVDLVAGMVLAWGAWALAPKILPRLRPPPY